MLLYKLTTETFQRNFTVQECNINMTEIRILTCHRKYYKEGEHLVLDLGPFTKALEVRIQPEIQCSLWHKNHLPPFCFCAVLPYSFVIQSQQLEQSMYSFTYGHNCHSRHPCLSLAGFHPTKTNLEGRNYYADKLLFSNYLHIAVI